MKHLLTSLLVATLIVFSCKKKDDAVPTNNSGANNNQTTTTGSTTGTTTGTTGATTTGGSTTGGVSGGTTVPTFGQSFYGLLTIRTLTDATTSSTKFSSEADAYFSQSAVTEVTDSLGVNAGAVLLNGDPLIFNQTTTSYSLGSATASKGMWTVAGANTIPSFTFDASFAFPVCHNPQVLPESISRSTGITIPFNVSNVTFGNLVFLVNPGNISIESGFGFTGTHSTLTLTPAQVELIGNADSAIMSLHLENAVLKTINGKDMIFKKESVLKQMVMFKP